MSHGDTKLIRPSFYRALRALRRPLVALCTVLLIGNLLVPAAGMAQHAGSAVFCHGDPLHVDGSGGHATHGHYQSCCFSAAVALGPSAALEAPARAQTPSALEKPLERALVTQRFAGTARIRAPPLS